MVSFDIRNALIPFSLLKISNAFKSMRPGEVMEVIANDVAIADDLQRLLPESGQIIMASQAMGPEGPVFRFSLKKNHQHSNPREIQHVNRRSEHH